MFNPTQNVKKNLLDTNAVSIQSPLEFVGKFLHHLCQESSIHDDFLHRRSQLIMSSPTKSLPPVCIV